MQSAKELLWPMLYVAARTNHTMRDVVRWVTTHDRPLFDGHGQLKKPGEVQPLLRRLETEAAATGAGGAGPPPGVGGTDPPPGVDAATGELTVVAAAGPEPNQ